MGSLSENEKQVCPWKENYFLRALSEGMLMPGGEVLLGFLGGSVQPGSRNPDPISDLKVSFSHTRFQTWPLKSIPFFRSGGGLKTLHKTENMSSLHQKDFLKSISNSHITLSFLIIWSWNDEHIDTRSYFPCKPYPMPDQNGQNLYLFSDQNGAKTLPFGAAHTYTAYIWECPPESDGGFIVLFHLS